MELTHRCNLRCEMCNIWREDVKATKELSTNEWKGVITGLNDWGVNYVAISGGEPFVRDDTCDVIKYCGERGIKCEVITNGTLIDREKANKVAGILDDIVFSIDAPHELHDEIRGVNGASRRVTEGIREVVRARKKLNCDIPHVQILTTVSSLNVKVLSEMLPFAEEVGADTLAFQYISETPKKVIDETVIEGREASSHRFVPGKTSLLLNYDGIEELKKQIKRIDEFPKKIHVAYKTTLASLSDFSLKTGMFPIKKCYLVRMGMVINPYGDVHVCSMLDYPIGNIMDESIEGIWNGNKRRSLKRLLGKKLLPTCRYCCCGLCVNLTPIQMLQIALSGELKSKNQNFY